MPLSFNTFFPKTLQKICTSSFARFALLLTAILLVGLQICQAETTSEKTRRILASKALFTDPDFESLKKGDLVAKLLPSKDKREVAVVGIIPLNTPLDLGLKTFQETMARQNKKSIMDLGNFSSDPQLEDIKTIELEDADIRALKQCKVGNCKLNLSAEMIERFNKQIDWNAPDHVAQANRLFREILLEYVRDYNLRGDKAILEIKSEKTPLLLRNEYESLFSEIIWLNDFAPEFAQYLKNYPNSNLNNVKTSLNWSKTEFGVKPIVTVTQTVTYTAEKDGVSQIISVTKQIFSTRYLDSSLWLTALIRIPKNESETETYLLYTNHSRSSALDGFLSGFKREIVQREALEKVKPLLEETKQYAEAAARPPTAKDAAANNSGILAWFENSSYIALTGIIIILIIPLTWLAVRFSRK